jgi:hypothetical protein
MILGKIIVVKLVKTVVVFLLNSHFLIQMRGSKPYMTNTFFYRLLMVFLGTHLENGDRCIIGVDELASFNPYERICKLSTN